MKYVLVWTDPAAQPMAGASLVHNLDLEVRVDDGSLRHGNGGSSADVLNNVELVEISEPAGLHRVKVVGRNVPLKVAQRFALVASGAFQLVSCANPQVAVAPIEAKIETSASFIANSTGVTCHGFRPITDTMHGLISVQEPYAPSLSCSWLVSPPAASVWVSLAFTMVDLEYQHDFVRVYDGAISAPERLLATVSGRTVPARLVAESGKLLVVFTSDTAVSGKGFAATFDVILMAVGQEASSQTASACPRSWGTLGVTVVLSTCAGAIILSWAAGHVRKWCVRRMDRSHGRYSAELTEEAVTLRKNATEGQSSH
jgi:hypothetical protein